MMRRSGAPLALAFAALALAGCGGGNYSWGWYVVSPFDARGTTNLQFLLQGAGFTVAVALSAIVISVLAGLLVALPALAVAGLHPATGGSGRELCSGDMLLEALVACAGVTLKAVATALDVPLRSARVSAEGDLDFRGTLGVARDAPVGFARIRLCFDVDTDAPQDKLDQLLKLTERYCVVYQTIKSGPPVDVTMARG